MARPGNTDRIIRPLLFLVLASPALWLIGQWWLYFNGLEHGLGFNPQEASNRFGGRWTIRMLILTLSISPFATIIGKPWPIRYRRMIGLFAFSYATLHLLSYFALDLTLDVGALWADILKRRYIIFGILALLCLLPLALTSTKAMIKRLGARRWRRLHRLVYLASMSAALHYLVLAKGNQLAPRIYAAIIAALLLFRLIAPLKKAALDRWRANLHPSPVPRLQAPEKRHP